MVASLTHQKKVTLFNNPTKEPQIMSSILNVTPQSLKNMETVLRNTMRHRITGVNLNNNLVEARRLTQEKQEVVDALHSIIRVIDAAKFASCATGAGSINANDYRATLAINLAALERYKSVVEIFEELYALEQGRAAA